MSRYGDMVQRIAIDKGPGSIFTFPVFKKNTQAFKSKNKVQAFFFPHNVGQLNYCLFSLTNERNIVITLVQIWYVYEI